METKSCTEAQLVLAVILRAPGWTIHGGATAGGEARRTCKMKIFTKSKQTVWEWCKREKSRKDSSPEKIG